MTEKSQGVPLVYPTQPWNVRPSTDNKYARGFAPNGVVALHDFCYFYNRMGVGEDKITCQKALIKKGADELAPWEIIPMGYFEPVRDINNTPLLSQAPVSACEADGQVYLFFNEYSESSTTKIYKTRFNGESYAEIVEQFSNQSIAPFLSPAISYHPDVAPDSTSVMMIWPGSGDNGYFYSLGKIKKNADSFGDDIRFEDENQQTKELGEKTVPGTTAGYPSFSVSFAEPDSCNQPGIVPYKHNGRKGFLLLMPYQQVSAGAPAVRYGFSMYDLDKGDFLNKTVADVSTQYKLNYGKQISIASIRVNSETTIPVLVDQEGNTSNFIFDETSDTLGQFGEWMENPISNGNGGGSISVSVGIPPSVKISASLTPPPTSKVSGATIVSSERAGGALLTGVVIEAGPLKDMSLSVAAVCLNYEVFNQVDGSQS